MKRFSKILTLIIGIAIAVAIFAVSASAESDAYCLEITDSAGVRYVENTQNLSTALSDAIAGLEDGGEIKLLCDVVATDFSATLTDKTVNLDLNGFNLAITQSYVTNLGGTAFRLEGASKFYVYSRRPNGNIFHASPMATHSNGTVTAKNPGTEALFYVGDTSRIYFGENEEKGASGDNLSIYANMITNTYASCSEGEFAVRVNGGSYYRYAAGSSMSAMFYIRDCGNADKQVNVEVKNATLNAEAGRIFYFYNGTNDTESGKVPKPVIGKSFNVSVENCVLAGATAVEEQGQYNGKAKASFTGCSFLASPGSKSLVNVGEGCLFAQDYSSSLDGLVAAKSIARKKIILKTNTFSFSNYRYDEGTSKIYADFNLSSLNVQENTKECYFDYTVAAEENTSVITWVDLDKNETSERWLNGSVPNPSIILPGGNDVYYYTFGTMEAVRGNKTYVAAPAIKFGLKINLTLSSDFIYNVYVPVSAAESIKEVRIDETILERSEPKNIDGVPHYRYSFGILPRLAADAYSFDLDVYLDDTKTEVFTQKCEMSIPAYSIEVLNSGKYSPNTCALMNKTLAYVKAACDYFDTASENLYYSVIGKISSVEAPTYREGEEKASIPEQSAVKPVLSKIAVVFDSQLKYRFYFKSDVDFSSTAVKISYLKGNGIVEKVLAPEDVQTDGVGRFYDVSLSASNMRSDVTISVGADSYNYNLSNYIYFVNNDQSSKESAKQLVYSLWEYSEAAGKYTNEIPDISVTIDETPISSYKIVANSEEELRAAEIFKSVILQEYGVELEILGSYDGRAIVFKSVPVDTLRDYVVSMDGDDLVIECAYRSFFEPATLSYVRDVFASSNSDINISADRVSIYTYGKILYSDFDVPTYAGSVEDFKGKSAAEIAGLGVENAFSALKYAHEIANAKGYDVYGESGKVYYVSSTLDASGNSDTIAIKTNTYWQGANFVIDDTEISPTKNSKLAGSHVFTLATNSKKTIYKYTLDEESGEYKITYNVGSTTYVAKAAPEAIALKNGFDKDNVKKLDLGLGKPAIICVNNRNNKQFIRYTCSTATAIPESSASHQYDYILVDADGNIDPNTPFMFDYDEVTSFDVYPLVDTAVTVDGQGCTMTTLATNVATEGNLTRNFYVTRSNSTVKNINHAVYNELTGNIGHTYTGFFCSGAAANVEFNGCVAQSRAYFGAGTYDITLYNTLNVRLVNFTQSNFYEADGKTPNTKNCWFIMSSNGCKNVIYDGCMLTRFDAHEGVCNVTIKNSTIASIRLPAAETSLLKTPQSLTATPATAL